MFKVKAKVQNFNKCFVFPVSVNCHQPLATKLCIVMHHHESECHSEGLICYLQGQGCSEGLYNQIMTVFVIATEFLTFSFTMKSSFFGTSSSLHYCVLFPTKDWAQ